MIALRRLVRGAVAHLEYEVATKLRTRILFWAAVASIAFSGTTVAASYVTPLPPPVHADLSWPIETYVVDGTTARAIDHQLSERGPAALGFAPEDVAGMPYIPQGRARFEATELVNLRQMNRAGQCYWVHEGLAVDTGFVMPEWRPRGAVSPGVREWWQETYSILFTHERQHAAIFEAAYADLRDAIHGVPCSEDLIGIVGLRLAFMWAVQAGFDAIDCPLHYPEYPAEEM